MIVAPSGMSATAASIERQTFSFKGIVAMFDFLSWMSGIRKQNTIARLDQFYARNIVPGRMRSLDNLSVKSTVSPALHISL
jgi:hypothetical protein